MGVAAPRIIFLNQVAGTLFRELAEDVARELGSALLYTGRSCLAGPATSGKLTVKSGQAYDRNSLSRRFVTWTSYFFSSLATVARHPADSLLFIVTNPPFLGLAGLFFKLLRGQRYAVLVYDLYPDVLLALGILRDGIISRSWYFLNRAVLERADLVFVISNDMASLLEGKCDLQKTAAGRPVVIHNWADVASIRPLEKSHNWFAVRHEQEGKTTVLYSGNMGNSHDIESIIAVARTLRGHSGIHFLFIGDGSKKTVVDRAVREEGLGNITLLPFQPEEVLPYSMATGDIGIVAYEPGTEGCIVPSKICYYMAAGVVPLIVCGRETDLTVMALEHDCGVVVENGDIDGMAGAIMQLHEDGALLAGYKRRARETAETFFSRRNTGHFIRAIEAHIPGVKGESQNMYARDVKES